MSTLYRKVLCSERLPECGDCYLTSEGECYLNKGDYWICNLDRVTPAWWLEGVTIPTNEEIEGMALSELPNPEWGAAARLLWKSGFKKALEILTNEK